MGIVAAFDKVLFFNEASKYCVLRLKTADEMIPVEAKSPYHFRDHLLRFVAVGYDLPRTNAVQMELEGVWQNGRHGCQLQVEHWREIVPPTIEGIRGYLSSGLLKGIGEKTADAIVERFGVNSLRILEEDPNQLLEIRGITEEKLEVIKTGYTESKVMRDLLTLLAPFKVTPATALKIYEHFGPEGVKLLRQSPYRLCQVPGFGFKRVDAIVQKSGGDLHDPMRVQGALFYALERSHSEGGHLYQGAEELIKNSLQLLNEKIPQLDHQLTRESVEDALTGMILGNVVVSNNNNIYLPHVYTQESETACKAVQVALEVPKPIRLAPIMERVKDRLGITLSKRQTEGVEMVFQHNLSIITGGPGTGKSTVLKAVIEAYQMAYPNKVIRLAAPTGKASRRMAETTGIMEAQTVHSLLGLRGGEGGWQKKPKPLEADFVIVDECSMMDMWLAWQLFRRLQPATKVLLVGDVDQLESVGAGDVFREFITSGILPVTVLDEIFRQAQDSPIPHNAKRINEGNTELYFCKDFAFIKADSQEETAAMIRSLYKKEIAQSGADNVQILSPFRSRGDASSDALNEAIREEVNPPADDKPEVMFGGSMFRLNDRIMQTKNNSFIKFRNAKGAELTPGVFNGEIGRVCAIESGSVTINYDERYARYPLEALGELSLSYASTVHKAQGSEYNTVIIPLLMAHRILLSRNVLYTAATRAKQRVLLVGQIKALYNIICKWFDFEEPALPVKVNTSGTDAELKTGKAAILAIVLILAVLAFVFTKMNMGIIALTGASILMLTGCIKPGEGFKAVSWTTIVIVAAGTGFGTGIQVSGAGDLIANSVIGIVGENPFVLCAICMLLATVVSNFMANNAALTIVAPISIGVATALGVDVLPFMLATVAGCNWSICTVLANASITITESAGYRTKDFLRYGLALNVPAFILGAICLKIFFY